MTRCRRTQDRHRRRRSATRSSCFCEHRQALITAAVTGELDDPGSRRVSGPDEDLFEEFICAWLACSRRLRRGQDDLAQGAQPDFDASLGARHRRVVHLHRRDAGRRVGGAAHALRRRPAHGAAQVRRAAAQRDRHARHRRRAAPRRRRLGVTFRLAYFKPAHGPDAGAGRAVRGEPADGDPPVAATRPSSTKTLDLCLFVNGIPVATAELKNPLTGQTVEHAIDAVPHRPRSEEPRRCAARSCTSPSTPSGSR